MTKPVPAHEAIRQAAHLANTSVKISYHYLIGKWVIRCLGQQVEHKDFTQAVAKMCKYILEVHKAQIRLKDKQLKQ
jgi:hypothetical protein